MLIRLCICLLFFCTYGAYASNDGCRASASGVQVQVLGSGGPELSDRRASSSYLIWKDGKAKLLVDLGSGSMFQLERTQANINDIEVVLLTHLHVDHSADLPALIKASFFSERDQDLTLIGPDANHLMPSTTAFVSLLFGEQGAYRYLNSYLNGRDRYQILPKNVSLSVLKPTNVYRSNNVTIDAVAVHHGPIPAMAWRVAIGEKKLVFSGDTSNSTHHLSLLAKGADLLVAHHAIPESSQGVARNLHMPPSVIGKLAHSAQVTQLILSHHMNRSQKELANANTLIKQQYQGAVHFANDLDCFQP